MVLTRFGEPFSDHDWILEVKHDGFRALAYVVAGDCRLVSRRGHVYRSFARLCESIAAHLKVEDAILDGEICCLGPDGCSQFNNLMYHRGDAHFYAFDLLWLDGQDLGQWTLLDRKRELRKIVPTKTSRLLHVDHIVGRGEDIFELACRQDPDIIVIRS